METTPPADQTMEKVKKRYRKKKTKLEEAFPSYLQVMCTHTPTHTHTAVSKSQCSDWLVVPPHKGSVLWSGSPGPESTGGQEAGARDTRPQPIWSTDR